MLSGWWFGTFFIFPYIGNNHPNWLSYFSAGWPNHQPVIHAHISSNGINNIQQFPRNSSMMFDDFPSMETGVSQSSSLRRGLPLRCHDGVLEGASAAGLGPCWWTDSCELVILPRVLTNTGKLGDLMGCIILSCPFKMIIDLSSIIHRGFKYEKMGYSLVDKWGFNTWKSTQHLYGEAPP